MNLKAVLSKVAGATHPAFGGAHRLVADQTSIHRGRVDIWLVPKGPVGWSQTILRLPTGCPKGMP